MRRNKFAFTLFAAAILFSMVREWSAPVACARQMILWGQPPSAVQSVAAAN